jgi:hypothetical protein
MVHAPQAGHLPSIGEVDLRPVVGGGGGGGFRLVACCA